MYLERLRVPHSSKLFFFVNEELTTAIDETSSAYSTFCTQNCPDEYEQRLTQVTSVSQPAKIKYSQERRHGKSRVDFEEQLVSFSTLDELTSDICDRYRAASDDPPVIHRLGDGSARHSKAEREEGPAAGPRADLGRIRACSAAVLERG